MKQQWGLARQAAADGLAIFRRRWGFWLAAGFCQSLTWMGLPCGVAFFRWIAAGRDDPLRLFASGFFVQEAVLTAIIWSSAVGFARLALLQVDAPKPKASAWIEGFFSGPVVLPMALALCLAASGFGPEPWRFADGWLSPPWTLAGLLLGRGGAASLAVCLLLLPPLAWVFHHLADRRPFGRLPASLGAWRSAFGAWSLFWLAHLAVPGLVGFALMAAAGSDPLALALSAGAAMVLASPVFALVSLAMARFWRLACAEEPAETLHPI